MGERAAEHLAQQPDAAALQLLGQFGQLAGDRDRLGDRDRERGVDLLDVEVVRMPVERQPAATVLCVCRSPSGRSASSYPLRTHAASSS